ncbi:MAG: hydroxylamine reductase, partial [Deltaproteobacteria bacterium]|nr:hydroxylamine reductase [Deltaproteobacteria bacterium]
MLCYQCEQTAKGEGCTSFGVCGKDPDTAALQDLLVHAVKGLAMVLQRSARFGVVDPESQAFIQEALFTTVTNVNFDPARLAASLRRAASLGERATARYREACRAAGEVPVDLVGAAAAWHPAGDLDGLVRQGEAVSAEQRIARLGQDAGGLAELVLYGLKGMAAYAHHARVLGVSDPAVDAFFVEALDFLCTTPSLDELTAMALKVGEVNLQVMGLLDRANTTAYGHPVPTPVRVTPVKGKAILVSGHDLKDLEELLEQSEGMGVNVYTHGEMLPAHGYPGLKRHAHLVGNYGGAWQDQRVEFDRFPGAILMTTNCI